MKDSETKCEYCEKIHPDWFACSKYVDLIVRSAPINAAPPETKCKCGCEGNNRGWSTEKVWDKKCIYHKDNLITPPETSSWGEQLAELINDHVGGRIDSVHIHNFVRNLASSEYKRGVEDTTNCHKQNLFSHRNKLCNCFKLTNKTYD